MCEAISKIILASAEPIVNVCTTLLVVIFTAVIGRWVYFRQKEYELVRQRYLENGIDLIVDHIASALQLFQQNWARSLLLLKIYRDLKNDTLQRCIKIHF
jgi:hypothetical protein